LDSKHGVTDSEQETYSSDPTGMYFALGIAFFRGGPGHKFITGYLKKNLMETSQYVHSYTLNMYCVGKRKTFSHFGNASHQKVSQNAKFVICNQSLKKSYTFCWQL
jgi:20S proteasome alpha/beta subunit